MASCKRFLIAAALLALSGGCAFAQDALSTQPTGFYADPVMPDPPPVRAPLYPPSDVTSGVASVSPAENTIQKPQHHAACTVANGCAAVASPARG